ncbi:MAG: aldo/keto reductase [Planctomycetota bacterium]|jgi:predicted aldo/keto reductase-like oxidoreductase
MKQIRLGRTGLTIGRSGFGALPIQRVNQATATALLNRAVDVGMTFIDTARAYSDSEEKMGVAIAHRRDEIIIATKSGATTFDGVTADLETSLTNLKTDHVDILQLHNPKELPDPSDTSSSYAALLKARDAGKIRFLGVTCHSRDNAIAAAKSGLYDTVQFPLCAISDPEDVKVIEVCAEHDVGVIAMKAMSGGLLNASRPAFAWFTQFEGNVVPIWGVQHDWELEEFIALEANPPSLEDADVAAAIDGWRKELTGEFCRACGYCLPCPAEIPIPMAARMGLLLRRMPTKDLVGEEWQAKMKRIEDCTECGACRSRCPYHLDPPRLLKAMYKDYRQYLEGTK